MSTSADFAINGRFLTQPITGVQRYARNVVAAMNDALAAQDQFAKIIAPRIAADPGLPAIELRHAGPFTGHAWEQGTLPARWPGRLLNLCNTAPGIKADQVICIHDANVFNAPQSYGRSFRALYGMLQPVLARRATRITSVSSFSAREIARHLPIAAADIAVLPNGHEHALSWDPEKARIAPAFLASLRERFVLAIGSRARHKNLKLLIDLAPELERLGVDLVLAGGEAGIFAADGLIAARNIHVTGYVSDDDLAFLMDRALCLAFPSWTEGFGLPIIESMARGCPVISSDRASMPEVCGSAALMAAPDAPAQWLRQVQSLLDSSDLRHDLAALGRERVKLFSWKTTGELYLELMRQPSIRKAVPKPADHDKPNIALVIATIRRPEIVSATVRYHLETQTTKPATVIVSCVTGADAGNAAGLEGVQVICGPAGLAAQRNTALSALPPETEFVVFFDDDFVADPDWLAAAVRAFRDRPEVVGFTGRVIHDDIKGPGLDFDEAIRLVRQDDQRADRTWIDPYSPYGCNMAFRMSAIGDLRFDERLVLYGWLEDRDFGASLANRGGHLVKSADARGVHMGCKGGRVAGDRLGYSQVVNPIYLLRKGTMTVGQVADHVFRNITSNVARAARPEPFIDRRGRLRGNLRGIADLLQGRIEPERATAIRPISKG